MLKRLVSLLSLTAAIFAQDPSTADVVVLPQFDATSPDAPAFFAPSPGSTRAAGSLALDGHLRVTVNEPADLALYVPGAYTTHQFGHATTFEVRGDPVETYLNGQRRAPNLFGWQPTLNGVAFAEILRGPSPVQMGPGFYTGGYVDYQTLRPAVPSATTIEAELGAWLPDGGSYAAARTRVSHTQLLGNDAAFVLSYEAQESDTFYAVSGGRDDHQDLYAVLAWQSGPWSYFLNGGLLWQAKPQSLGVNRPTPALMNDHRYTTGGLLDSGGNPFDPATDFLFGTTIQPTGSTELPREATLLSTGDFSNAVVGYLQFIATADLTPDVTVETKTLIEGVDRRRYHQFEYTEYVEQAVFDQQLNFRFADPFGLAGSLASGLNVRRQSVTAYVDYFHEYFFAYDLSQPGPYNAAARFPADYAFPPGRKGPGGRRFYGAEPPPGQPLFATPESTASDLSSLGLWLEHEIDLPANLTLRYGLRGDMFCADAEDSLPPPGDDPWSDHDTFTNGSATTSLRWAPSKRIQVYTTLARISSVNGSLVGGGLLLYESGLDEQDYENRSDLFEVGVKWDLDHVEISLSAYHQTRARQTLQGGKADIIVEGVEAAASASPATWLSLFANATYVNGHYDNAAPIELGGPSIGDSYAGGAGYNVTFGTQPPGNYALPGLAEWQASTGSRLDLPGGFALDLWARWQSDAPGNLRNEFRLPAQFLLHVALSWQGEDFTVTITGRNLTDSDFWTYNGSSFLNNQLVGRSEPRRVMLTLRWER